MSMIEIKGLTKIYGQTKVLDSVNFMVPKGKICGLVGENGAGKTTLLKIICGLSSKTEGVVKVNGTQDIGEYSEHIGISIENPSLYPYLTAKQNLEAQRLLLGIQEKEITLRILASIGLENNNLKAEKFSSGMKQRLAIGLALIGSPSVLLLDEPFQGLDPIAAQDIADLLYKLREQNVTIVIADHILEGLLELADVIEVMKAGRIISEVVPVEFTGTHIKKYMIELMKGKKENDKSS